MDIKEANSAFVEDKEALRLKILTLIKEFEDKYWCVLSHTSTIRSELTQEDREKKNIPRTIDFNLDFCK